MACKRKRAKAHEPGQPSSKKHKKAAIHPQQELVKTALLPRFYRDVLTLREYLLSKLPATSQARRRKILGLRKLPCSTRNRPDASDDNHDELAAFLDSTLVGIEQTPDRSSREGRQQEWTHYSQKADVTTSTFSGGSGSVFPCQAEIIDFSIWLLFKKAPVKVGWASKHLLCQGFRKAPSYRSVVGLENPVSAIPGLVATHQNDHVSEIKSEPWPQLLLLMGKEGEATMIDLVVDCGIFVAVEVGQDNYYQLSGMPVGDLPLLCKRSISAVAVDDGIHVSGSSKVSTKTSRSPVEITLVRNRMLYSRAAVNVRGSVIFGLPRIHVLNRFPYLANNDTHRMAENAFESPYDENIVHVAMYIFPRQFGLHNVFTSETDVRETVQPFQEYTLREEALRRDGKSNSGRTKIPRRLKGEAMTLVKKLCKFHNRCSYKQLLDHCCPTTKPSVVFGADGLFATPRDDLSITLKTQQTPLSCGVGPELLTGTSPGRPRQPSMLNFATPINDVSVFCRAVLSKLVPNTFWGSGAEQEHNRKIFLKYVDRFVTMRRFESFSLHEVCQGIKISTMKWLAPNNSLQRRPSRSDTQKRLELLHELLYYLFDSLLIPLIQTNFYVTESSSHKYKLFFFRHDVWLSLSVPALASLKQTMFEEVPLADARKILDSRKLGFSHIRLLPKETGVRPIMNLRRRVVMKGHKTLLGSSINSLLAPVYNMLVLEKSLAPERLGSSLFCVEDLYPRLKTFLSGLSDKKKPLFFAKIDVQAAFDTIPQSAVLRLMSRLPGHSEYKVSKHMEMKPAGERSFGENASALRPSRKWNALASVPSDETPFVYKVNEYLGLGKKNTIFVDNVFHQYKKTKELVALLTEHVQQNLVKVGKRYYRQKAGVPQGSVVSSLLCNFFYADLEATHLGFLQVGNSLLLRLIDDFLLITTDCCHAKRFLQITHNGLPEYGVTVNPSKTLANFEVSINGRKVDRLVGSQLFPYCGNLIDTKTLNIMKDGEKNKESAIANSLTVEYSKSPGRAFNRKILNYLKLQAHAMFLDTSMNSLRTVLMTVHDFFSETARKMCAYIKCLPSNNRPGHELVTKTITGLVFLAFTLCKSKSKNPKNAAVGYRCSVTRLQIKWLALTAFQNVLSRRQTGYKHVLSWLNLEVREMRAKNGKHVAMLASIGKSRK